MFCTDLRKSAGTYTGFARGKVWETVEKRCGLVGQTFLNVVRFTLVDKNEYEYFLGGT